MLILASRNIICGNPEELLGDSVIISGYTDPAVEGTTVTFHCPTDSELKGPNTSTCMESGEWEPVLYGIKCSGTNMVFHENGTCYF